MYVNRVASVVNIKLQGDNAMTNKKKYEISFREMYGEDIYEHGGMDGGFDEETDLGSEIDFSGESDYSYGDEGDLQDGKHDRKDDDEAAVPGIKYLPNGEPVYSGIFHNNGRCPDAKLVHNDLVYVFDRIRKEGITTFDELRETDVFFDDRNLFEAYGRALRNGVRFMVSSGKHRGLILQQKNRSNGVVDFDEACDYIVEMFLFRPSFFGTVVNSVYSIEVTVKIVMSFVGRAVKDCSKHHKVSCPDISELERDLQSGTVRDKYVTYNVSANAPIGGSDDSKCGIDCIADRSREDDFRTVELLSSVESYAELLSKRKVPKNQIDVFRIKAKSFLVDGVHVTPAEIAEELGVSVQTVYSSMKKIEEFYKDFAMYIAS